jgi:hypothetical protein
MLVPRVAGCSCSPSPSPGLTGAIRADNPALGAVLRQQASHSTSHAALASPPLRRACNSARGGRRVLRPVHVGRLVRDGRWRSRDARRWLRRIGRSRGHVADGRGRSRALELRWDCREDGLGGHRDPRLHEKELHRYGALHREAVVVRIRTAHGAPPGAASCSRAPHPSCSSRGLEGWTRPLRMSPVDGPFRGWPIARAPRAPVRHAPRGARAMRRPPRS